MQLVKIREAEWKILHGKLVDVEEAKTAADKELAKTREERDALREDIAAVHVSYSTYTFLLSDMEGV